MTLRRAKMIRDLQLQRRAPQTQQAYGSAVAGFAKFYQCSPDRLRPEPIRTYRHRFLLMTTYAAGRRVSEVVRLKLTDSESEDKRVQTMTLDADECIRRFLWHVRPRGFMRLRHDGFLAHRHTARTLRRCRELLGQPAEPPTPSKECGTVEARGHGYRPHAMSPLWRSPTHTAPAALPGDTPCQPRNACGGAER